MQKGFTLIELVVVIAIIGILSSVIAFSVAQYISKSKDANMMGNLAVLVSAGEVFYNGHSSSYDGFCSSSVVENAISQIPANSGGSCTSNKAGLCCYDTDDQWAACAPKFFDSSKAFCVDSRGVKMEIDIGDCIGSLTECPD